MKRYLLLLLSIILFIFNGCKKDGSNNNVVTPVVPGISIQSISYPSFVSSTWNNVLGGNVSLEFDLLNTNDSVSSKIIDSTALKNISTYNKTLTKGNYNIYLSSKNQTSVADTFIRFNAQIKSYSLAAQQSLSLTATTNDGLITIAQSFVQNNTVPTFKADLGSTVYKLGVINGFYYLYVKGGTSGAITFTSKASNQTLTKSLNIVTLNQYNLAVQTNKGSLQVVFAPFAYNQVAVNSNTLLTLHITPAAYISKSSVYFVVTDESGNILNEVKYVQGTSVFKISSLAPFTKDRFNFFEIDVDADPHVTPNVIGFLQIKKGSIFTTNPPFLPQKPTHLINPHLKNSTGFDKLSISTDLGGFSLNSLADTLNGSFYSSDGRLWVQMLQNNQYSYNFFNIPSSTTNYNVDLTKLTETPLVQNITAPGNNLSVEVLAKADTNYSNSFNFGVTSAPYNTLSYYYPSEAFQEYDVLMDYTIGNLYYTITTAGKTIPNQAAVFNASFNIPSSTLANFVPSYSGNFDYYYADFINTTSKPYLQVALFSPSAGNYTHIMLPDFSKYLGVTSIDFNTLPLKFFGLYQVNGFNEQDFFYPMYNNGFNINSKTVARGY
ncbi:MAG: hypothetical protein JWQ63_1610 [Mucilaginibacter sp.]|nr:hypothetical protein [Mucilaginibacter sp.]